MDDETDFDATHDSETDPTEVAAMDHAVLSDMEFDALTPRLHRKEAQHLAICPFHGLMPVALAALEASAGREGMSTAEKIEALQIARGNFADGVQAHLNLIIKHFDAAIADYEKDQIKEEKDK